MEQPSAKRPPGRPTQHGEVKRAFFQTRIRESLKRRLETEAAEEGRSLSEEVELKLELASRDADLGRTVFGDDPERFGLLQAIDRLLLAAQMRSGKGIEDRDTRHAMADSISGFLKDTLEILPALAGRPLSAHEVQSLADDHALQSLARLLGTEEFAKRYPGRPVVTPAAAFADPAAAAAEADAAAAAFIARFPDHPFSRRAQAADEAAPPGEAGSGPADEAA